jgi:hypothetical protein
MIAIVESVTEISVERVDIIKTREVSQDHGQTIRDGLLSELDLTHAVGEEGGRGNEVSPKCA